MLEAQVRSYYGGVCLSSAVLICWASFSIKNMSPIHHVKKRTPHPSPETYEKQGWAWGMSRWPNKDDQNPPCKMTKNGKGLETLLFFSFTFYFLLWIWPKMTTVNVYSTFNYENKVNICLQYSEVVFGHTHTRCYVYSCRFWSNLMSKKIHVYSLLVSRLQSSRSVIFIQSS